MSNRLKVARVAPQVYHTMRALQNYVESTGLEKSLLELVKLRASYINTINAWNRLAIPFQSEVGWHKPLAHV